MKTLLLSTLLLLAGPTSPAPPTFTKKPTATRAGDKVRIEFAVSQPTDVAVFIEDAKGRVVRHVAAGVLGKNPPKPFKPDSLDQSLEWDGKGDWGKPAGTGPFRIRVALGLGASYDNVVASAPENFGRPTGLGIGKDGTLYVAAQESNVVNWDSRHLVALNRDGSYRRTLIPRRWRGWRTCTAASSGSRTRARISGRPSRWPRRRETSSEMSPSWTSSRIPTGRTRSCTPGPAGATADTPSCASKRPRGSSKGSCWTRDISAERRGPASCRVPTGTSTPSTSSSPACSGSTRTGRR